MQTLALPAASLAAALPRARTPAEVSPVVETCPREAIPGWVASSAAEIRLREAIPEWVASSVVETRLREAIPEWVASSVGAMAVPLRRMAEAALLLAIPALVATPRPVALAWVASSVGAMAVPLHRMAEAAPLPAIRALAATPRRVALAPWVASWVGAMAVPLHRMAAPQDREPRQPMAAPVRPALAIRQRTMAPAVPAAERPDTTRGLRAW
jgi:hypothetical protein